MLKQTTQASKRNLPSAAHDKDLQNIIFKLEDEFNSENNVSKQATFDMLKSYAEKHVDAQKIVATIYFKKRVSLLFKDHFKMAEKYFNDVLKTNKDDAYAQWMLKRIEFHQFNQQGFVPPNYHEIMLGIIHAELNLAFKTYIEDNKYRDQARKALYFKFQCDKIDSKGHQVIQLIQKQQKILIAIITNTFNTEMIKLDNDQNVVIHRTLTFVYQALRGKDKDFIAREYGISREVQSAIYKSLYPPITYDEAMKLRYQTVTPHPPEEQPCVTQIMPGPDVRRSQYFDFHIGLFNSYLSTNILSQEPYATTLITREAVGSESKSSTVIGLSIFNHTAQTQVADIDLKKEDAQLLSTEPAPHDTRHVI